MCSYCIIIITFLRFNVQLHQLSHDLRGDRRVALNHFEQDFTSRPRVAHVARRSKQTFEGLKIFLFRFLVFVTVADTSTLDHEYQCLHVLRVRERWPSYCGWRNSIYLLQGIFVNNCNWHCWKVTPTVVVHPTELSYCMTGGVRNYNKKFARALFGINFYRIEIFNFSSTCFFWRIAPQFLRPMKIRLYE